MTITDKQSMRDRIDARFRSGNSVPVERAAITASEWAELRAALEAAEAVREVPADERAKFEEAMSKEPHSEQVFIKGRDGEYRLGRTEFAWRAWRHARAQSSDAPLSAQPSADDAPRPVAWAMDWQLELVGSLRNPLAASVQLSKERTEKFTAALYAAPPADARDGEKPLTFRVHVSTMLESCGESYLVCIDRSDLPTSTMDAFFSKARITPYKTGKREQADYEAAVWSAFLCGTEHPDLAADRAMGGE